MTAQAGCPPSSSLIQQKSASLSRLSSRQFSSKVVSLSSLRPQLFPSLPVVDQWKAGGRPGDALALHVATSEEVVTSEEEAIRSVQEEVTALEEELKDASPLMIMDKVLSVYGKDAAIAFSGAEDVALIELASLTGRPYRVFCLDTGRLHPETYRYLSMVEQHYSIRIEVMFPDAAAVQSLVQAKGLFSFYEDGHAECCSIRKVEPLKRALRGLRVWITGQRRDQAQSRVSVPVICVDGSFKGSGPGGVLVKANPLAGVTGAQAWRLLRANGAPTNPLHERGFVSIGCEPCTRPVLPHQHEREGRWWWEQAGSKECGLHSSNSPTAAAATDTGTTSATAPSSASSRRSDVPDIYQHPLIHDFDTRDVDLLLSPTPTSDQLSRYEWLHSTTWLLVVYAPWCPHCQALQPALEGLAHQLAEREGEGQMPRVRVAKFQGDLPERDEWRTKLHAATFPTILAVHPRLVGSTEGSSDALDGAMIVKMKDERRDVDSMMAWVSLLL